MLESTAREARTAGEGVDILRIAMGVERIERERLSSLRDLDSIGCGTSPNTIKTRLSGPIQHFCAQRLSQPRGSQNSAQPVPFNDDGY